MINDEQATEVKPPWSLKKRVVSTILLSGLILVIALLIGGVGYEVARYTGLIQTQSLKDAMMVAIGDDPELVAELLEQAKARTCEDSTWGFQLTLGPYVRSLQPGDCTSLETIAADGSSQTIRIVPWPVGRARALEIVLSSVDQAETMTVNGPLNPVLLLGTNSQGRIARIVVGTEETAWVMEPSMVDDLMISRMKELVLHWK